MKNKSKYGFTIVELLVVIAIIGVMSTIGIVSFSSIQSNARNAQRSSKITILAEALEKYFDKNGSYPSCADLTTDSSTVSSSVLVGLDPAALTAPSDEDGVNSITCTDPVADTFGYIGGSTDYVLKYNEEGSSTPKTLDSRRHVASTMYTLTIVAGTGGTVNASGTYDTGTVRTITATPSTYYSFSSWTGSTGCSGVASHTITMDANKTCTANFTATAIATPATPTVTANTVGATTTFSWGATSCPGNTARYQYRYTISPQGYDSGLVATASTSVAFTTSTEGQTYTVATQAQCYNTATSSSWSTAGSGSYLRPATVTSPFATGGTVTLVSTIYTHTFTSSGTFTSTGLTWPATVVISGAGGGGGGSGDDNDDYGYSGNNGGLSSLTRSGTTYIAYGGGGGDYGDGYDCLAGGSGVAGGTVPFTLTGVSGGGSAGGAGGSYCGSGGTGGAGGKVSGSLAVANGQIFNIVVGTGGAGGTYYVVGANGVNGVVTVSYTSVAI